MNQSTNCKVIVCCHKKDICANSEPYLPIQVGKALSDVDLGIQGDDTGENISEKNASYCELTGLYWAWKNLKNVEVIGLCHYRRYFDFHGQCKRFLPYTKYPTASFDQVDLSIPDDVIDIVSNGTIIVARPRSYRYNLMVNYCLCHNSEDFDVLRKVIESTQSIEIVEAFQKVFYEKKDLSHFNMFLMPYALFKDYCEWLFFILEKVESMIDISHYSNVQKRIFGYMAERLLNVWIETRKEKVLEAPVIWFNDGSDILENYSPLKYYVHSLINDLPDIPGILFDSNNLDFDR